ncbi:arylamine N-acetyltransferase [Paenibacillus sp. LC231]|uniref:arylamine N-acetyltransferase n=1 Tax=Paenibacillus sp. LC231 TaxID=1120679 RepID=UPI000B1B33B7|nr:arylamine N-acetyltransferase [Paenibacillus sp. LC231]
MNIVQNQGQLPQWANNYLQYIQVPIREASLEYLTEICTAHHQRVPFENITTLLQYQEYHQKGRLEQDEKRFVDQLWQLNAGGTCYMINSSLHQLLNQLGFETRYTLLGGGHVGLLVRIPGEQEEVYVDCGNSAPFFEPVRLESDPEQVSQYAGIEVRLRPGDEPGTYTYYRYADGRLITELVWSFDTRVTYQFDDFQPAIASYFQPNDLFTSSLRCQLWQLDQQRSLSLVDNVLSIRYANGKVEKRILSDLSELREVIDHEFHLPKLPVEDAVKVLQELGFNIFKGSAMTISLE